MHLPDTGAGPGGHKAQHAARGVQHPAQGVLPLPQLPAGQTSSNRGVNAFSEKSLKNTKSLLKYTAILKKNSRKKSEFKLNLKNLQTCILETS